MANPWEQDWTTQGQQSTGAPWEQDYDLKDDPAKRALPDGVKPSTVAGGRGNVNPAPVRQMPDGVRQAEYGLADIQPTVTASTGQAVQPDARKRESVLEDHPASRPWDMRSTIKARADIEAMPQARPEASMQETPLPTQIGMDLRNSVPNPAARGVVAGLAGLGTVIPGAIQAGADLVGADGVADYSGRVARTGEQISSPMRPNAGGAQLAFDIANSITQTAPTLIVGLGGGPAMTALFGQVGAQEYTQGRSAGLDGGTAAARAGIMAGAEVIGERFGFSEQIKILKGLANRVPAEELAPVFARQILKEIPGEQLTTLLQFLGDKAGPGALNPEATLADYLEQAGHTLKVTIGQTAVMGGTPVAINAARQHMKKPVDRTPQIKALRAQGDEVAAAHMEQRAQKEQAAYSADVEAGALANFSPELAQRYRETRITGAKMGDAVVQTAARWNFEQAAQVAGLTPKAQQAIADAITQLPPEKVPGFVQKAITGLVEAGVAQPFDGMDQIAANIENQRDQMLDSVLGAMDDINQLEDGQDGAQDTPDAALGQAFDAGAPPALAAEQRAGEGPGIAESALPDGQPEQEQALSSEWQQFPQETETLGVPRAEMPQVKTVHRGPLVNFLGARGVTTEQVEVDPADLKPTQAEFSQTKVQEAADRDTDRSILISSDGYIIDGHHQAIAKLQNGKPVRAIRLGAPAAELLPLVREFPSSTTDQSSDEQNAPQATTGAPVTTEAATTGAEAPATQAPAPARGDGAAAAGVPDTGAGAGVRADGVNTASWVIREKATGAVIMETFDKKKVDALNTDKYEAVPIRQHLASLSKNPPNLNTSAEPAQKTAESEQVDADQQRRDFMAAEKKRAEKRARLTRAEWEKNPLREFLGRHGVSMDLAKEFAPGTKERRKAMVAGHGPIFRKAGKNIDMLAEAAAEEGFTSGEDADALYELIGKVFRGERVAPLFAEGVAESEMEDRMRRAQEDAAAEFEDFIGTQADDPFGPLTDDEIEAKGYDSASDEIKAEVDALIAMAESMGIDIETLREDAARATADKTEQDYYEQAREIFTRAIGESTGGRRADPAVEDGPVQREEAQPAGRGDRGQADGGQGQQDGVTDWRERAGAKARSDLQAAVEQSIKNSTPDVSNGIAPLSARGWRDAVTKRFGKWGVVDNQLDSVDRITLVKGNDLAHFYYRKGDEADRERAANAAQAWAKNDGKAPEAEPAQGVTLEPRPDGTLAVTGDPDALKQRLTDAGIPAKSVLKSKTGVVVGKTQADKARDVLDPPTLTAPTKADIEAQQARAEQAARDKAAADRAAERTAAQEEERKRIAKASEQAAETFELGGDAMANLTGQQDIFGAAPAPAPAPKADPARQKAADDLKDALGDLGDIFGKNFRSNIVPEQEQKLLPVLSRVMDAAFRLGYLKFKDAAKFTLDKIREALGADVADAITIDHLQGAYIAMAGKYKDQGADTKKAVVNVEDKAEVEAHTARADNPADQENRNAASPNERVERDRGEPAAVTAVGNAVPGDTRDAAGAAGETGGQAADGQGSGQPRLARIQADGTPAGRERGDQRVPDRVRQAGIAEFDAGTDFGERGGDAGVEGVSTAAIPASEVADTAVRGDEDLKARAKQREADKIPVKTGDIDNIRATLPYLLEGQQDDVLKTEQRFAAPDGYGMLFTNGTGTGKTFTGLGVVKRFARQGKTNTLIVVPDDKIAADWIDSARALGLTVTRLESTKDAGRGISITTYANLGDNDALATRQWDLVVSDEAHSLMQSADGKVTGYLENLRAITHHPDGVFQRYTMLNRPDIDRLTSISERIDANNKILNNQDTMDAMMTATRAENEKLQAQADKLAKKLREALDAVRDEVKAQQGAKRTRAVFLSATPFAYEKTIDWANGYLFDYNEGREDEAKRPRSYNEGSNREQFFMQHFGYTMRYNKLNSPDPRKVDTGLMQRQFNSWLKKRGALSGRMLDVKADYDRRFVLVESAVGNQIDAAIEWIEQRRRAHYEQHKDKKGNDTPPNGYDMLQSNLNGTLYGPQGHLLRRYLLEAIKAKEVVPIIKQHMAMGRKVVVFHDFKKGGAVNPFKFDRRAERTSEEVGGEEAASQLAKVRAYNAAAAEFNRTFPDLAGDELLSDLQSPIERFTREFPDVLLINGDEKKSDLLRRYKDFNDDAKGAAVALVQSDKDKGWSGHDTTGKHQRVLFNLGLPTKPTKTIQQEGRIYRTGQVSNALFRYLNTGTNWERWAFAQTIAERASAAENLGMGELSRALKDSFVSAFEESDTYPPGHEGEGTGGKERDKAANNTLSEWDRAKSFYWGTQKKNSKTKAQEGVDYFATPEPVGLKMVHWLRLREGEDTLEPSGGHGAIARWLPDTGKRTVIEPSSALRSRLAMVMNPAEDRILDGEFEDLDIVNKFDGIAMNPPFGSGGKTAIEHVAKAATHLRDGGRIVALIPTGPAADKRFDQWFYETEQRPLKPAIKHPTLGDIYVGDTIKSRASWAPTGVVTSVRPDGSAVLVKTPEGGAATMVTIQALTDVQPTGKRTREVRPAEGLHLVADIKLPQVTFERAGTKVATRIVVIEKQTDAARAPTQNRSTDLTDITDIGELFDRIEDIEMPARAMTKAQDEAAKAEEAAPAAKTERTSRTPAAKPEKPAKAEVVPTVDRQGAEIVEHVTGKGKTIRGIIRKDLTKEQAQAIDPYTWKKDGGFFIREKYLKPDTEFQRLDDGEQAGDTATDGNTDTRPEARINVGMLGRDIARYLKRAGEESSVRPYDARVLPGYGELQSIAEAFGSEVQGFGMRVGLDADARKRYGFFGGVRTSGVVFLRQDAGDRPHLAVLGHELGHELRTRRPDLYDQLVDAIRPYVNVGKYEAEFVNSAVAKNQTSPDKKQEEFIGEVLSDGFMDPDFWRALGRKNQSLLEYVGNAIFDMIEKALKAVGYTKRSAPYLTDYKAVMRIAGEVMAEFGVAPRGARGDLAFQATRGTNNAMPENQAPGPQGDAQKGADTGKRVAELQRMLAAVEAKYEVLRKRKNYTMEEWDAIGPEAAAIRTQLFNLTGDWYGRPKAKKVKPSDEALEAEYATPDDVPKHVMEWLQANNQILTSDATDAVRWARIVDTRRDARYPAGDLTIYRAVVGDEIRPGDWVTTDRQYAEDHARKYLGRSGQVVEMTVDGRDVLESPTGNAEEAIYAPREFSGKHTPNDKPAPVSGGAKDSGTMFQTLAGGIAGLPPEAKQTDMLAPNVWSAPEPTKTDRVIYELQDGRIDLKRVQQAIKDAGEAIPEKFDARLAETLYPGRVATRAQRFLESEVKPLLEAMSRNNIEMDELADYLHARGAKERNAQIAKVNPDLPDGGAGKNSKGVLMTNAAADVHLAMISPARKMALDAMAARVDAITKGTRQLLVAEGLEKQETIDAWEKAYKTYVPMFRDEAESGNPHPTGSGMSVRGSASKRATGSTKQVTNILAHVLMQREAAITRAEKNRVAVALYGLALTNPNRDFWTTIRPGMKAEKIAEELERMGVDPAVAVAGMSGAPTITTVDPVLGVKVSRPNPIYKSLPGAITVRLRGEDRVLMLNTTDPRGARMAENLKNLDGLTKMDIAGSLIGKATRWMASVNTQYNPAFGLVNLIRDTVGGSINLTSTPLRGKTMKVLALTGPALKGIALELSGKKSGEWGRLFRQFQADGGQTGFRDQFKDASERTKLIAAELKQFEKAGQLTPGKVAHKILDALDIFNTTLENAVRLAAYREGLLEGMSRPAAARLGRELTVDFNRKGRIGREAGPLYAFFNASVQGSARTLETLRGPAGQKIIAGGVMLGVMQAIMLLAAGYDDDEIPEFVKTRALIIPLPWMEGKQYLSIPLPLGLHVLPNTGRVLAELTLDGGRDAGGKVFNALGEIAGAFNPLGGGNVFTADGALKTLAPTVVDPVIEIGFNRNFAGTPIEREKFGENDQRPGFERAREMTQRQPTGQAYLEISRVINTMTGGDDYEAGKVSPTPEAVRYLAQVVGGGLLREAEKIVNTTFDVARGEDVKPTGVPIFGRLYGEVDDDSVQRTRFYANLDRITRAENVLNAAAKKGDAERAEKVLADKPEVVLGDAATGARSAVAKLNKAAAQTIGDRETSKALDEARTGVMRGLNQVADEIDRPRREATAGAKLKQAMGLSDAR